VSYLLQSPAEPARIRAKTDRLLIRHHLDWAGLEHGQSFVDFGCASGEVMREAARVAGAHGIVGIDGDGEALEYARAEALRLGLTGLDHREAFVDGPGSSGLDSDRYDHAWARFFLEYHARPLEAIRLMVGRVLQRGSPDDLLIDAQAPDEVQERDAADAPRRVRAHEQHRFMVERAPLRDAAKDRLVVPFQVRPDVGRERGILDLRVRGDRRADGPLALVDQVRLAAPELVDQPHDRILSPAQRIDVRRRRMTIGR
jgi:SAM-dependent methyltransferase